jgi:flagellar biosynthesis/type III secretory pathway protein FliH
MFEGSNFSRFVFSLLLAVTAALSTASAETVNQSSDWLFSGAASSVADTYVLTTGSPRESGSMFLSESICAREFKLGFEIDLGGDVSPVGGDGVFISFLDSEGDHLFRVHTDSFFHGAEDPRYELDGNHVSVESVGAYLDVYGNPPTSGATTFGPIVAGKAPFTMEGSGWFYGEIHRLGRVLKITITNGTAGLLLTAYLPSTLTNIVTPGFEGIAMNGMNEQKLRNISLSILDNEGCADYVPPLSLDQARALLVNSCGDVATCPDETEYLSCVTQTTQLLLTDERIESTTAELLELEAQYGLSFCSGYDQCETDIDEDSIRDAAYDSGYADGVTDGDAAGYARGLEEGDSAGYTRGYTKGKTEGYIDGFDDGDAAGYQRGVAAGQTTGYDSGFTDGKAEGITIGDAQGFARGYTEGKADGTTAGYSSGFDDGRAAGYTAGLSDGDAAGFTRGYDSGLTDGQEAGYESGFSDGDEAGFTRGYDSGLGDGQEAGYASGLADGDAAGFTRGYESGFGDGKAAGDPEGYERGLAEGQSIGFDEGFDAGYAEGQTDAPSCEEPLFLSFDEAMAQVNETCSCEKYRWHAARVVCSVFKAKKLHDKGLIEAQMKGKLVSAVAKNKCK